MASSRATALLALIVGILVVSTWSQISDSYDYIVIGGGTSGCVIAEKLSRDPKNSVLVLEKGGDQSETFSGLTGFYGTLVSPQTEENIQLYTLKNIYDAGYRSFETASSKFRPQIGSAAILAGGGSVINGNAMTWPSRSELAYWNSSLWTFEATLSVRKELETYMPCFESGGCDEKIHGDTTGMSIMGRNIEVKDGKAYRQDSFSKVLKPHVGKRSNLKVLFYANVQKLKIDKKSGVHEVSVLFENQILRIKASKRVIISCGSMCTPRLLMHSGVGDCAELKKFDIDCVASNPKIGKNLIDAVAATMAYISLTGPPKHSSNGSIAVGYYRSPQFTGDGTDMEVSVVPLYFEKWFIMFFQMAMNVHSNYGYITLKDKDPNSDPLFTFNFLNDTQTALPLVDQFRKIRKAMVKLSIPNVLRLNETLFMLELDPSVLKVPFLSPDWWVISHFTSTGTALKHMTGGANLHQVVNNRLELMDDQKKVIPGITLADLSVVPAPVRSHSGMSMAMLIGGRVADLILEENKSCEAGKCGPK